MKRLLLTPFFILSLFILKAQKQTVSIGTTDTNQNAVLWLKGDGTQGLIIPIVSNLGSIQENVQGMIVYSGGKIHYNTGSGWTEIGAGGGTGGGSTYSLELQGNELRLLKDGSNQNVFKLSTNDPSPGSLFMWDGSRWTAVQLTGDAANANGTITVNGLKGKSIPTLPSTSATQALVYDGTNWGFQSLGSAGGAGTVTSITAGTGLTGGTINTTGTIAVDVGNTANKIPQLDGTGKLNSSVLPAGIDANAADDITTATVASGGDLSGNFPANAVVRIQGRVVSNAVPSNQDVLKWNGTAWAPAVDNAGSSVILSNGQILTGNGTVNAATPLGGDATLSGSNLIISTNAIGGGEITDNTVASADILDGTIVGVDLANNIAINTSGAITFGSLSGTGTRMVVANPSGVLSTQTIAAATNLDGLSDVQINPGTLDGHILINNGTNFENHLITGDIELSEAGVASISIGAGENIATAINDLSNPGTISGLVINPNFFNQNISTIGTLTSGNITAPNINLGGLNYTWPTGHVAGTLTNNGSGILSWGSAGSGWGLTGNTGTNPTTNFIGTIGNEDLVFKTSSTERLRIQSGANGNVGIGTATPGQNLEVFGSGTPTIRVKNSSPGVSGQSFIDFGHDDGSGGFVSAGNIGDPGSGDYLQIASPDRIVFNTAFTQRMNIFTDGSVNISSPISNAPLLNVENLNGGGTGFLSGAIGGRIITTQNSGTQVIGLETKAAGAGASNFFMGAHISAEGTGSTSNRGLVASATGANNNNTALEAFSTGNTGTNYGATIYVGGTQATQKTGLQINASGSGTKVGVQTLGEDHNSFSGEVGIGTSAPEQKLDVIGYVRIGAGPGSANEGLLLATPSPGISTIAAGPRASTEFRINQNNAAPMTFMINGLEKMRIDAAGKVGIGVSPTTELHVAHANGTPATQNGFLISNAGGSQGISFFVSNGTGNLGLFNEDGSNLGSFDDGNGNYTPVSDLRMKKNIRSIESVLPKVNEIGIRRYHFKRQKDNEMDNIGVIAQELKEIYPELVKYDAERDYYTVDYMSMAPLAIKAIQEQQLIIDSLRMKIQEMEVKLTTEAESKQKLESKLDHLSKEVEQIKLIIGAHEARKE